MNGPAALPIQYAESMIALAVTLLVCPAVTLDSHDNARTNPVVPTPGALGFRNRSPQMGRNGVPVVH